MNLSKVEMLSLFRPWLVAWNEHNLEGVMELLHEDIVFENWTGATITGKNLLRKMWTPWFLKHGNFKFFEEDIFIDEQEQKMLFRWQLEWPSLEILYQGNQEIRRGVDVLHFLDGKIYKKYTYSKTTLLIDSKSVSLRASQKTF